MDKPNRNATLPFPRLELRWRLPNPEAEGESSCDYVCDYMLVIGPPVKGDRRSNDFDTGEYGVHNVEYVLNTQIRSGGPELGANFLDAPYADGAHGAWDSATLNLPVFVTFGEYSKPHTRG